MMIETLISMARYLSARKDDDIVDRMNYLYTPNMLLAFSVLISFKQFGGRPLECMFPNKFPGSWEQYAENLCWSEDTYYLPPEVHVAQILESERYSAERKLSYYQWVPFFLLIQAACFRLPSLIWKAINLSSGVRVHDIVLKAQDSQNMEEENRQRTLQLLANHLSRALRFQNQIMRRHLIVHKTLRFLNITYSACFVSFMYLVTKFLYLGNVLMQLYLMNKFLETDRYQWYGLSVIKDIMAGIPWQASGYFPRVTLCDFTVRQVANIQKYSVQCVLVINIFNEKIFILLWCWYALLLVATLISIAYWSTLMFFPLFGRWYIAQALELYRMEPGAMHRPLDAHALKRERKNVVRFVNKFLKNDGVFTLRMLGLHTGILFTSELVAELYRLYEQLMETDGQTFSEDTTLKLEDGGGPLMAARFQTPTKKGAKQKKSPANNVVAANISPLYHSNKEKGSTKQQQRRAGSAPAAANDLSNEDDEQQHNINSVVTTSLIPLALAAGNKRPSTEESSSSSEDEEEEEELDLEEGGGNRQRQKKRR